MLNLVKADIYKSLHSASLWIVFLLSCLGSLVTLLSAHFVAIGKMSMQSATSLPAFFVDSQMITLLICFIVGISFCTDFENKTISTSISSGYSRNLIILSKIAVLLLMILFILLPYVIPTVILSFSSISFTAFVKTPLLKLLTANYSQTGEHMLTTVKVILTIIFTYFGQLCIAIPVMFLFRKPVTTLAISYMLNLLLGPLANLNEKVAHVMKYTPFRMDLSSLLEGTGANADFLQIIFICVVFIFGYYFLSQIIFRKAEIA